MKIYVAGRTKNVAEVNQIQQQIEARGHEISHDWTGPEGAIKDDHSDDPQLAKMCAIKDYEGVVKADAVIMCGYGCSEDEKGGLGCFIEAGVALANNIPIIILGPMRESVFWYAPIVARVTPHKISFEDEIATAIEMAEILAEKIATKSKLALGATDVKIDLEELNP